MLDLKQAPASLPSSPVPTHEVLTGDEKPSPVAPKLRIPIVDILRGFALLGILLVNMQLFHGSYAAMIAGVHEPATLLNQLARWFVAFFGEGKFYSIFACLFGLGLALQYARAQTSPTRRFGRYWLRRMAVLLGIGLIHAYLIWVGDILILYSVLGAALLLWRNARPRTLLVWALILLILPLVFNVALFALVILGSASMGEAAMLELLDGQMAEYRNHAAAAAAVYATGSYGAITAQRAQDMNLVFVTLPFIAPNVLAMMLLGLYAGKRHIFEDIPAHLPFIRKLWFWGLAIGLVGNFLFVYFGSLSSRTLPSVALLASLTGQTFGAPALAIFYMSSLVLLAQRAIWRRRLMPLSYVGRMALTNYLLQSIICTALFYGYGFGLYDRIGIAGGILLTVFIYALQVIFSVWWLRRFQFGPMEWLWRTLTYGRRQPMALASQ